MVRAEADNERQGQDRAGDSGGRAVATPMGAGPRGARGSSPNSRSRARLAVAGGGFLFLTNPSLSLLLLLPLRV